jgi:ATP synthase I subunit
MESIREVQKKYCSRAITLAIFTGLVFVLAGEKAIAKGLIMGTLFSIFNFILIGETLPMRTIGSKNRRFFLALGSISFRYLVLAIPLVIAIKMDQVDFFAAVCGIFLVQFVLLFDHFLNYLTWRRSKQV